MMAPIDHPTQDLPTGLAERLHRLADDQTAGSSPWPGVDLAVRRSHRRRVAGVSSLAAASVLVIGSLFAGAGSSLHSAPTPPAATTPTAEPRTLEAAGLVGPTGGSLGNDSTWLDALRGRIVELTRDGKTEAVPRQDLLVLWAGDLNGSRYAVVKFKAPAPNSDNTVWNSGIMTGAAGAAADTMEMPSLSSSDEDIPTSDESEFVKADSPQARSAGVVFVTAPRATKVEVATARRFGPTGTSSTDWRPLAKQGGAVWAGELTAAEFYLFDTRIAGVESGVSGYTPDTVTAAAAIASPDTDLGALGRATDTAHNLGASLQERPVLAASQPLGGRNTFAATLLRSPEGGYLFGMNEQHLTGAGDNDGVAVTVGAISAQAFASPDAFMAAVQVDGDKGTTPKHPSSHYLVIAPVGADRVTARGVTVKVVHRLAVIDLPAPAYPYNDGTTELPAELSEVRALDPTGVTIGTVTALTDDTDDARPVPGRPDVSTLVLGNYNLD